MRKLLKYSFLLLLIVFAKKSYGQNNKNEIIVAYTYNFSKYITWPNESEIDTFKIKIIGGNSELINEFDKFSQKRKIKGKPVKIISKGKKDILNNPHIILLTENENSIFDKILNLIGNQPILIVTDNYDDKRFVMINLYTNNEEQILFEVNKSNIINQNLSINPEILLAGGTEIDIASLYRKSQINLRNMQNELNVMEDSLGDLSNEVKKSLNELEKRELDVENQKKILSDKISQIDSLQRIFHYQNKVLKGQKDSIKIKNYILDEQFDKINNQWEEINTQERLLRQKQVQIDSLNMAIESKNTILGDQTRIIRRQKIILFLSFLVGAIIVVLIIMVFISYRDNKQKNALLVKQKGEIEENLAELKKLNIRLKNADHYKSIFLASMSHELRTPLNSIIGYTGIMLMGMTGELNEEQNKQLVKVKNNANHLLSLINDILDISKIEAGKVELETVEFKLIDVVNEVIETIKPKAEEKQIAVASDVNQYLILKSDKRRVKQVILNLVSNAVKYSNSGSVRIFTDYLSESKFRLTVKDTGIGISENDIVRLFQPFQQIDSTLTRKNSGTGLGLYLCRKLMSLLGGHISVKSELGKGSEFYFEMPTKINSES